MENQDSVHKGKLTSHEQLRHKPGKDEFFITGIGASAGGIQALQEFFANVPANSDVAYVVILHLSPDHDSLLAQILQTVANIPVAQVTEKVRIEKNHAYVVPPNQHLTMEDGYIVVSTNIHIEERRAPVDIFFRTLAEQHGERAVAVILSGTGANGSMGIKRVKEKGGVVFVQSPAEAQYGDMPRNSIATDLVDEVLNVAEIPAKIIAYKNSIGAISIPVSPEDLKESEQAAIREIFTQLRVRTGHDFTNYKRATILRRIERRINVHQLDSLTAYSNFLCETPEETIALLKDLLISVTNFFRDEKAFSYIEKVVLPDILKSKKNNDTVRIWVAGCATGEEAYSLAMLIYEKFDGIKKEMPQIQIFASDIDDTAIATAREGLYTLNDAADVSTKRLRQFFTQEADSGYYRIKKGLRELILFAHHNVIKDPPFSHLDLITCRNMLIYLNQDAQNRVMETFHFALNPGGYLFLGSSESIDGANDLYLTTSKEHHVFQSRQTTTRPIPLPERTLSVPSVFNTKQTEFNPPKPVKTTLQEPESRPLERISIGDLHQRLLEQYAPPSLIINENYDVVHLSEKAGEFLQVKGGEPSNNILKLIKPELRLELRTALYQAMQQQTNIAVKNVPVKTGDDTAVINLHVRPVLHTNDTSRGFVLVMFETLQEAPEKDAVEIYPGKLESVTLQLEEEITNLRSQLRLTNEQFEVQAEELKASNEELQAINEELRSAAEELETSKEELQSVNEELITVNEELKVKIEEVSQSNNDFQNLINSTTIGTIFLDRHLRVKLFTPPIQEIFNLIPADIGRSLSDITNKLEYTDILEDAEDVLKTLHSIEKEVTVKENLTYLMHVSPYRTAEDRINGVVISFINVTKLKYAEKAMHTSEERIRLILESAKDYAIFTLDLDRHVNTWNSGAEKVFGYFEHEIVGKSGDILFIPADCEADAPEHEAKKALETGRAENERLHMRKDGTFFYGSGVSMPLRNDEGIAIGFVKIMRDLTESKKAEEALQESEKRFRTLADAVPQVIWTNEAEGAANYFNQRWFDYSGLTYEESVGLGWEVIVHPGDANSSVEKWNKALTAGEIFDTEYRLKRHDGVYRWFIGRNVPLKNETGEVTGWFGTATDIEDIKQAEEALKQSEARLKITMESAVDYAIIAMDTERKIERWSNGAANIFGYSEAEVVGKPADLIFTPEDLEKNAPEKEMEIAKENGRASDERWHIRRDGTRFYMSGVMAPIYDGTLTGYVKVARDMTESKLLEQQKDDFLGIASHELKTPVTSIKAYAEVLQEICNEGDYATGAGIVEKLNGQVDRLIELIHALLDTTKITTGQLMLKLERFNLHELIEERAEEIQRISPGHSIKVSQCIKLFVMADKERISQVLTNLILNAVKYSPNGGDVTINCSTNEDTAQISVHDKGIGISKEAQEKVFERFFRVKDSQVSTYPGMGLGLYITANIIHRHGGKIWVESTPGEGSVFYFTLPLNNA